MWSQRVKDFFTMEEVLLLSVKMVHVIISKQNEYPFLIGKE